MNSPSHCIALKQSVPKLRNIRFCEMSSERVIALIDMDCFYVQCEQRLAPELWSHPCAVAQYNSWKGGGLIAVNYEARGHGVKRGIRGNEAIALCPDIHIFSVPEVRGKADLSRYREASEEVFEAIKGLVTNLDDEIIVEKASIDEAFVDLSRYIDKLIDNSQPLPELESLTDTKVEANEDNDWNNWFARISDDPLLFANDIRLLFGALVVQQIRKEILDKTKFKCSAGISHNKMLAKLACAINKPNAQTILTKSGVDQLFRRTDINKVRCLGGKLGSNVKKLLKITTMFELKSIDFKELAKYFDPKTAKWLKDMANGLDDEPLTNRQVSKSLGCGKNFPGKTALATLSDVEFWVKQLSEELVERMTRDKEVNKRSPKLLTVGFKLHERDHNSRSLPLDANCSSNQLSNQIMKEVFNKMKFEPIVNLSIAASKFIEDCDDPTVGTIKLDNFFSKIDKRLVIPSTDVASTSSSASASASVSDSDAVPAKSIHTKTLSDFWKVDTNGENVDNNCASISNRTEEKFGKPYNPWNCSPFSMKRYSEKLIALKSNGESCDQTSYKTSVDELEMIAPNEGISDNESLSDIETSPPIKRGFFFRKLMQMKQKNLKDSKITNGFDSQLEKAKQCSEALVVDLTED